MTRPLAYCAFRPSAQLVLPASGVKHSPVQMMSAGPLALLWSEAEWPFESDRMQKSAVEFHEVVHQVFRQTAVIPFRLLSVFDGLTALEMFFEENRPRFLEDLHRLSSVVQMECVIYPAPGRAQADRSSGKAYLEQKAVILRSAEDVTRATRESLAHMSREVRVRDGKNGTRIFVLVDRGRENDFRQAVSQVTIPDHLSRRVSGPWPAGEFLSEQVKMPQITGEK